MTPNWLPLDGVVNMRDLGGLPTTQGGAIQPGRLIRSDNLQDLSATDVSYLLDVLGVTDVVDLRSDTERRATGPGPLHTTSVRHHHLSLFRERPQAPRLTPEVDSWVAVDTARRNDPVYWQEHYLGYLEDRPDSVLSALGAIADAPGATIVHCAAGKDRTGTIVALALSAAGVPSAEVIADYVASAERIEAIIGRLSGVGPYTVTVDPETLAEQAPQARTMEGTLTALGSRYGGAAGWLHQAGWGSGRVESLRRRLTS
ncbi:MAG: tyrosine-protein phosphatase [Nostocoides sp.]